ncbi:hypothetical protein NX059_005647 [Plenodomus lindquistii]|nr:hypothetical protein NX059_005647 [Plenodomus lindquistii]
MKRFSFAQLLSLFAFILFAITGAAFLMDVDPLTNYTSKSVGFEQSTVEVPGGNRRGIAYNNVNYVSLFKHEHRRTTWCYNWDSRPYQETNVEFVPMLHSIRDDHIGTWYDNAMKAINGNRDAPTHLLGFNEPDNCIPDAGGSCMSVGTAVAGWKQHMQPLKSAKGAMFLGSPAVTNSADTPSSGLGWLRSFMEQCTGCDIDFINIHWYDSSPNVAYFKQHIQATRKIAQGRPIWITEFKPTGSDSAIKAFLEEVMPWLDASSDIHRYAYFMATTGNGFLINAKADGLSDLGMAYQFD